MTQISEDDQFIYCGTTTGDIMKINMKTRLLATCGPVKAKYSLVGKHGSVIIGWCHILTSMECFFLNSSCNYGKLSVMIMIRHYGFLDKRFSWPPNDTLALIYWMFQCAPHERISVTWRKQLLLFLPPSQRLFHAAVIKSSTCFRPDDFHFVLCRASASSGYWRAGTCLLGPDAAPSQCAVQITSKAWSG